MESLARAPEYDAARVYIAVSGAIHGDESLFVCFENAERCPTRVSFVGGETPASQAVWGQ